MVGLVRILREHGSIVVDSNSSLEVTQEEFRSPGCLGALAYSSVCAAGIVQRPDALKFTWSLVFE